MTAKTGVVLDDFRGSEIDLNALLNHIPKTLPRHRQGTAFLKGPIPWLWLSKAMTLPGKALHVAVLLWREAGCSRNRTIRFRLTAHSTVGLTPQTARRGIRALESAGLISVQHHPGQALEVTLMKMDSEQSN
jgi:hypothetical protein